MPFIKKIYLHIIINVGYKNTSNNFGFGIKILSYVSFDNNKILEKYIFYYFN